MGRCTCRPINPMKSKSKSKRKLFPFNQEEEKDEIVKRKSMDQRAEELLELIRSRHMPNIWHNYPKAPEPRKLHPRSWHRFKRDFVDQIGDEKVKETGFTDSQFLDYFKTGRLELEKPMGKLQRLLHDLHNPE